MEDDEVARRLVMKRSTWDALMALATERSNEAPRAKPLTAADVATEALMLGLAVLRAKAEGPADVTGEERAILEAIEAIGPAFNRAIRDVVYRSFPKGAETDPAGCSTTAALGRLKARGLVDLCGRPRRWSLTGRPWKGPD